MISHSLLFIIFFNYIGTTFMKRYLKKTVLPHQIYGMKTHRRKIYSIQLYWFDFKFMNFATIAENSASMRPHHFNRCGTDPICEMIAYFCFV